MQQVKAIETVYQGYRFRSRLEARWAVFFDSLGIKYEYEKEGFNLGKYGCYLPDFWLPDLGYWIEIKPDDNKESGWPIDGTQIGLLPYGEKYVICGTPFCVTDEHGMPKLTYEAFPCSAGGDGPAAWDNLYLWCECPKCGDIGLEFDARYQRLPGHRGCEEHGYGMDRGNTPDTPKLLRAMSAAQQARFEHGERG